VYGRWYTSAANRDVLRRSEASDETDAVLAGGGGGPPAPQSQSTVERQNTRQQTEQIPHRTDSDSTRLQSRSGLPRDTAVLHVVLPSLHSK
jgi:hypothetical protein